MNLDDLVRPAALGARLAAVTGDDGWLVFDARLISGGKSNLTFLLTSDTGELILRRPPNGQLLPSAHDMRREARVQAALAESPVPVPRIVMVDDGPLLGTPCYVMTKVQGHIIRNAMPDSWALESAERTALALSLVDTLARLHAVEPAAVGLADFGRPEGYLVRQLARWTQQWNRSATHEVPAIEQLAGLLRANVPPAARSVIVHGDFKLDNCVVGPDEPAISAVLDWEMSTLGDPLTDLGLLLFYWRDPGEPPLSLAPSVSTLAGFPSRATLAARYAEQTRADLTQIDFYIAFANFKFAVIAQGIAARVAAGAMAGQSFGEIDSLVRDCAQAGLEMFGAGG